jgi:hypothetical protein
MKPAVKKKKTKSAKMNVEGDNAISSNSFGRDISLSLFHSLGKILHCKSVFFFFSYFCSFSRKGNIVEEFYESDVTESFREPLMTNPIEIRESISHIDSMLFNHYVFENYLNFFEIIEDSSIASQYLSDRFIIINGMILTNFLVLYWPNQITLGKNLTKWLGSFHVLA